MMKKLLMALTILSLLLASGCHQEPAKELSDSMPFWLTSTMKNESVMLVNTGAATTGNLMFTPSRILSVKDSSLTVTYEEGKDYSINGRIITRLENSSMPYLDESVLYGIDMPTNKGLSTQPASPSAIEKGYSSVLYTESSFLFTHQIFVTYDYEPLDYQGYKQTYQGENLPNTLAKLQNKEELNIVVYGDSISTGCNASGSQLMSVYDDPNSQYSSWNIEPFGKSFPELFADELTSKYGSAINLLSAAKGGMASDWGKNNAITRAYNPDYGYDPDLVIIHFGVNDSTMYVNEATFKQNIQYIIDDIRRMSTKTVEFILIGAMYSNPDAIQYGMGTNYINELNEIAESYEGVITVDVGSIHQAFINQKRYVDLTANGVNHPNDFLHRLYAMALNASLVEYEE